MGKSKSLVIGFAHDVIPPSCSDEEMEFYRGHGEWDSDHTVQSIIKALERPGSRVIDIPVYRDKKHDVYYDMDKHGKELDIVFNIAEGFGTKNREALIPAMLEWLHIPFTGSDTGALATALNKADTTDVLGRYGISVPKSFTYRPGDTAGAGRYAKALGMEFPMVVKPVAEGTSMGMTQNSVVQNEAELDAEARRVVNEYKQPAIVQAYIDGKEYTVGILGDMILPILEIDLRKIPGNPKVRDHDVKDIDSKISVPARFGEKYVTLASQTAKAQSAIRCLDYNRMDFREGKDGVTYFLEMNPLPGLNPTDSDFPNMAKLAGIDYDTLLNSVIVTSIERYQTDPEFSGRFDETKVGYLRDFTAQGTGSVGFYSSLLVKPDEFGPSYRLAKVIK